jgi:uncharacterized protein YjbI with pentapeptide repeats
MLIPNKDQPSLYKARQGDSLSSVARARTLTVLPRLDDGRKGRVVQFLYECGLIAKGRPILALGGADLSKADLIEANLREADLSRVNLNRAMLMEAHLEGSDLKEAFLMSANLYGASLRGADLSGTFLNNAVLWEANLVGASLNDAVLWEANLREADLSGANLSGAALMGADLRGADLSGVDLSGATGCSEAQLAADKSLKGATMPDGRPYELRSGWLPPSP